MNSVESPRRSSLFKAAALWLAIAALALVALYARLLHVSFDGDYQGWASASCMTMAHSFNQLGALHLHFVPIQNNLPLGSDPDVYLHWPPLFPLLLSVVTRILGDHESSGRLFALTITLATTGVVMAIARRLYGTRVALLSGFFFLTARATYEGGRAILHQPLAMFFGSATVLLFLLALDIPTEAIPASPLPASRRRLFAILGLFATICTVFTAWDPIFIPFGLLFSSLYLRRRNAIRLAGLYLVAAVLTFVAVQVDYILSYPALFKNQFATIAFRAGLKFNVESSMRLHTIVDSVHYTTSQLSFIGTYSHALRWLFEGFGTFTLLAPFLFLALWFQGDRRQNLSAVYLLGGLGLPWLIFYAAMRNYVSIHPFALVLGAPFLAITSGFVLDRIWDRLHTAGVADNNRRHLLRVMVAIFPLLVLYPLFMAVRNAKIPFEVPQYQYLSPIIQHNTPPEAVTLSSAQSAVPIYYSDRHIVRGIVTPELLQLAIPQARAAFPGSPLFFALQDEPDIDRASFTTTLQQFTPIAHQGDSTLYAIP
ncbi:MAG TPA: glycosyltransferase family 39 protein [Edaphobacter sp.]|nr:glycosyltransferase family 39 protein [Edaphobacter sp.]